MLRTKPILKGSVLLLLAIFVFVVSHDFDRELQSYSISESVSNDCSLKAVSIWSSSSLSRYDAVVIIANNAEEFNKNNILMEIDGNVQNLKWINCSSLQIKTDGVIDFFNPQLNRDYNIVLLHNTFIK